MKQHGALRPRKCTRHLGWVSGVILLIAQSAWGGSQILGVRHWSAPSSTRVVVDLSGEVTYRTFRLSRPPRVVVDMEGVGLKERLLRVRIRDALVDQVRMAGRSAGAVRLVLDLRGSDFAYHVFFLHRIEDRPHRLVIDVDNPRMMKKLEDERRAVQRGKQGRARVVVIDPGHGGEDPGAVGPGGVREKDVVLKIARELYARLNRRKDLRAFLTRKGDYFLSLRKRVAIAQEYGADLFLSIHADGSMSRRARGGSVYCLSLRGATDEAARILAERENASDRIGGVRLEGDRTVDTILLDLVQTRTINSSLRWGGMVLREMERVHRLKFSLPRQAGFRVLKAPDIPSVLVEVGFITNPSEERLMRSSRFQRSIASALESATCRFLCQEESMQAERLAFGFCEKHKPRAHVVRPGQNLAQIASLYDTSVKRLQEINEIRDASKIYAGQKIKLP